MGNTSSQVIADDSPNPLCLVSSQQTLRMEDTESMVLGRAVDEDPAASQLLEEYFEAQQKDSTRAIEKSQCLEHSQSDKSDDMSSAVVGAARDDGNSLDMGNPVARDASTSKPMLHARQARNKRTLKEFLGQSLEVSTGLISKSSGRSRSVLKPSAEQDCQQGQLPTPPYGSSAKGRVPTSPSSGPEQSCHNSPKRKRQEVADGDATVEVRPEMIPRKRQALSRRRTIPKIHIAANDELPSEGPFVKDEVNRLERFMAAYCNENKLASQEANDMIQSKSRENDLAIAQLWTALFALLPNRKHSAIRRTCRRRFHNYDNRGKWTEDDDEDLKQAYIVKPGKWVAIGKMLSRMPEDCRDRWRDYVSCGTKRRTSQWTAKEEALLHLAVQECTHVLREDAVRQAKEKHESVPDLHQLEESINFNIVSQKMGHTRSRLQCYSHWKVMQDRDDDILKDRPPTKSVRTVKKSTGKQPVRDFVKSSSKKLSASEQFAMVEHIAGCGALVEADIPWKSLYESNPNWPISSYKEAFNQAKGLVRPQKTLKDTLDALLQHFANHQPRSVRPPRNAKKTFLSAEKVVDSDEENSEQAAIKGTVVPAEPDNDERVSRRGREFPDYSVDKQMDTDSEADNDIESTQAEVGEDESEEGDRLQSLYEDEDQDIDTEHCENESEDQDDELVAGGPLQERINGHHENWPKIADVPEELELFPKPNEPDCQKDSQHPTSGSDSSWQEQDDVVERSSNHANATRRGIVASGESEESSTENTEESADDSSSEDDNSLGHPINTWLPNASPPRNSAGSSTSKRSSTASAADVESDEEEHEKSTPHASVVIEHSEHDHDVESDEDKNSDSDDANSVIFERLS